MISISVVFLIVGIVFLLCAIFAPLSYDGILLSPSDIGYYISKFILYLLSGIYFLLFSIVLLYYFNRRLFIRDNLITFINFFGKKRVIDPRSCEIKVYSSRFDLFMKGKKKKICSISLLNDGDVFNFINKIERAGVTRRL